MSPGDKDAHGCSGKRPAQICVESSGFCYSPENDRSYVFGLKPKVTQIGNLDARPLLLFQATFSGCGSGTLTSYSLLTFRGGELVNLLPPVKLTEQSEIKWWLLPEISNAPVLATADFIWDTAAGEAHFASHRYRIDGFAYDPKTGIYAGGATYETSSRYPGLDQTDEISILASEKSRIISKLEAGRRTRR